MSRHIRRLNNAIDMVRDHPGYGKAMISAILFHGNRKIGSGLNTSKSHSFAVKYSKNPHAIFLHAEQSAIYSAEKLLGKSTLLGMKTILYVARLKQVSNINEEKIWGLAKPCDGCMKAIREYGISKVIYTLDQEYGSEEQYGVIELA